MKELLFEYCNENKKVPIRKTEYKNQNIGSFLGHQKNKINSINDELYKKLSENKYIKESLDNYLKYKEKNYHLINQ